MPDLGGKRPEVAVDRDEIVVARHDPEAVVRRRLRMPVDGLVGAKPVEVLVRDALDECVGIREVDGARELDRL